MSVTKILNNCVTASPTYGSHVALGSAGPFSVDFTLAGTGALTGTGVVQVSNDEVSWKTIGTVSLSGTTTATDAFAWAARFGYVRVGISALGGGGTGHTFNAFLNA